jgi:hypothetical protein
VPLGVREFPIRQKVDDDGDTMVEEEDDTRFLCARAGDHLLTPFQCETCHFRNMLGRNPRADKASDTELKEMIRRANLDSFWSRETATVKANVKEARRMEKTMKKYGLPPATPPMGPWPLEDVTGMKGAIAVLDRSLDPGIYEDNVQWDTFRKQMSTITNISQAAVGGLENSVGAYERKRMWISNVVSHQFWFSRFMTGIHKRVGQVRKPDKEMTIEVLHAADAILEEQWSGARTIGQKKRIAEMGTWFSGGFCTGLRGEEMLNIELAGTANSLTHLDDEVNPHFKFILLGRTKGNQLSGAKFGVPCVPITEGTNLRPGRWVKRLVETIHTSGRRSGRLFSRRLATAKMHEFEDDFFTVLEKVQATTNSIEDDVDIRDVYGLARSERRGVTAHARNMEVPGDLLNAVNRWRTEATSATGNPRLDMMDVYTTLEALIPTVLRFSRAL